MTTPHRTQTPSPRSTTVAPAPDPLTASEASLDELVTVTGGARRRAAHELTHIAQQRPGR
jgi:hypothetical protein